MFWKIYWAGVIVYTGVMVGAWIKIGNILEDAYRESDEFKERIDGFTVPVDRQRYWEQMSWKNRLEWVAVGLCPVVHWIAAAGLSMLFANDELLDELIRETLDKILN